MLLVVFPRPVIYRAGIKSICILEFPPELRHCGTPIDSNFAGLVSSPSLTMYAQSLFSVLLATAVSAVSLQEALNSQNTTLSTLNGTYFPRYILDVDV